MKQARKDGLGILGIGAAACVAWCAGPILAFLGGLSFAGLAITMLIGTAGFGSRRHPSQRARRRPADLSRSAG